MRQIPSAFSELLSKRGERVLAGRDALCGALRSGETRFVAASGLIDPRQARGALALIDRAMKDVLSVMSDPIPGWTISGMQDNYSELLPKTVRNRTAMLESRRSRSFKRATDIGLVAMLRSKSFHDFAQRLSGFELKASGWGTQALCYGPGDYSGPHNDHHPEEPEARDGYTDLHLTLSNDAVADQRLIYARDGHFSEWAQVATLGGITCYRLPFWHFTTPLVGTPTARRWVLLGTFLDASTHGGAPGRGEAGAASSLKKAV